MKRKVGNIFFNGYNLLILFLVLFLMLSNININVALTSKAVENKISDEDTTQTYINSLGDNLSTRYNGRVWTDKTVYTNDATFGTTNPVTVKNDSNFLIAYSNLATTTRTQNIIQTPVDVVFVVDLSGSMLDKLANSNKTRLQILIDSLNTSINNLLSMSEYNRVAVVGYRSGGAPDRMLELKHYKNVTFSLETVGNDTNIKINTGGVNKIINLYSSKQNGTNSHVGVYEGMNILASEKNTSVKIGETTVKRVPSVVLMSDGWSTHSCSDTDWWHIDSTNVNGNNEEGFGGEVYYGHSLKTMMTATYMKEQIQKNYNNSDYPVRVYTFGMGLASYLEGANKNEKAYNMARAMLNPNLLVTEQNEATNSINSAWQEYIKGNAPKINTGVRFRILSANGNAVPPVWKPKRPTSDYDNQTTPYIYKIEPFYYQKYAGGEKGTRLQKYKWWYENFEKNNIDPLKVAFETKGESANKAAWIYYNYNGYTLNHPGIDDISSLDYSDGYYQAEKEEDVSKKFDEIVNEITTSLPHVPTEVDENNPVNSGFIEYTDTIGKYMEVKDVKAILWNSELFENKSIKTINGITDYSFTGNIDSPVYGEHSLNEIKISVKTETNGDQTLTIKVPATAIPIRSNTIKTDINGNITNTLSNAYPMRVFYTVGLSDKIKSSDGTVIASKISQEYLKNNRDPDTCNINFYSNLFTGKKLNDPKNPNEKVTIGDTYVTFHPAKDNPFYYTQEEFKLYTDESLTNRAKEIISTGKYYFEISYYQGNRKETTVIERSGDLLIERTDKDTNGNCYIKKGVQRLGNIATFAIGKEDSNNLTQTADSYYYPTYEGSDLIKVYLGNNGVLSVFPDGVDLTIQKTVDGSDTSGEFAFDVDLSGGCLNNNQFAYLKYNITNTSNPIEKGVILVGEDGNVTFKSDTTTIFEQLKLQHNQKVVIKDLPAGIKVNINEIISSSKVYDTTIQLDESANIKSGLQIDFDLTRDTVVKYINKLSNAVDFNVIKVDGNSLKIDENGNITTTPMPLQGAQFKLYKYGGDAANWDEISNQLVDSSNVDKSIWLDESEFNSNQKGELGIGKIYDGKYRLVEAKAPGGYKLPKGQWNIIVDNGQLIIKSVNSAPAFAKDNQGNYYLPNYKPLFPPLTGGQGQMIVMLVGFAFVSIGSYMLVKRKREINLKK